jgi:hypothetical protein
MRLTFATAPSGDWTRTVAYGPVTLGERKGFEDDPIVGAGLVNDVDSSQPAPALPSAGGNITLPLDLNHIGPWLKRAFGAPGSTGTTPDYTHVFSSGVEMLPTFAAQIKKATSLYYVTLGCAVNRLTFNASRRAGYDRIVAEIIAAKETKFTSTQSGTPAAMLARIPIAASLPIFKVNDAAAGQVMAIDAVYDNKLIGQDFLSGDEHIAGIERDVEATFSGTIRVRFKDATYHDLGISGGTFKGELLWTISSVASFGMVANVMRIERTPIEIAGPGGIEVSFPFRCEADATNPMLIATLKNAIASY